MATKVFVYTALWKEGDKFEMGLKTRVFGDHRDAAAELQADAKEAVTCFSLEYGEGNYDYSCDSEDHAVCEVNTDEGWLGDRWEARIEPQYIN